MGNFKLSPISKFKISLIFVIAFVSMYFLVELFKMIYKGVAEINYLDFTLIMVCDLCNSMVSSFIALSVIELKYKGDTSMEVIDHIDFSNYKWFNYAVGILFMYMVLNLIFATIISLLMEKYYFEIYNRDILSYILYGFNSSYMGGGLLALVTVIYILSFKKPLQL